MSNTSNTNPQAITTQPQQARLVPMEPSNLNELYELARQLSASEIIPATYRGKDKIPNIIAAGMMARDLGISTMLAMREIYVVHGRPAASSQLLNALVRQHPDCLYFRMVSAETNDKQATFETHRRGDPSPTKLTYTLEDAKQAGLYPGKPDRNGEPPQWGKRPKLMLRRRAASELAKEVYPDAVLGLISEDEALELPLEREMGPATRVENVRPLEALPELGVRETIEAPAREAELVAVEKPAEKPAAKMLIEDQSTMPDKPADEPTHAFPDWAAAALDEYTGAGEKMPKPTYDKIVVEIQKMQPGAERAAVGKRLKALGHAPETTTQRQPGEEG